MLCISALLRHECRATFDCEHNIVPLRQLVKVGGHLNVFDRGTMAAQNLGCSVSSRASAFGSFWPHHGAKYCDTLTRHRLHGSWSAIIILQAKNVCKQLQIINSACEKAQCVVCYGEKFLSLA